MKNNIVRALWPVIKIELDAVGNLYSRPGQHQKLIATRIHVFGVHTAAFYFLCRVAKRPWSDNHFLIKTISLEEHIYVQKTRPKLFDKGNVRFIKSLLWYYLPHSLLLIFFNKKNS